LEQNSRLGVPLADGIS